MSSTFILSAVRTPIGKFLGGLGALSAPQLGAIAIKDALARSGFPADQINEVIFGQVLQGGVGQAPARQAALLAGLPDTTPAVTINKVCGSGLKAVMLADQAIRAGDATLVIAGGMESMSRAPFVLQGAREGLKFGNQQLVDLMLFDGLTCSTEKAPMGNLADWTAAEFGVSREQADLFSLRSHERAVKATVDGAFREEIVGVTVVHGKESKIISQDEGPRADANLAGLAKLRPAFGPEGIATAGNASQISDGAAALVVVGESVAKSSLKAPLARVVASTSSARRPKELFVAPADAIAQVLGKAQLAVSDIDLFEINEAFAAQTLACMKLAKIPEEKTNISGGAIALGHPIGASGARVLVTLIHNLRRLHLKRGLATLCLGGGGAVAMIIEVP
jgi:acetyl-CoA C-acetyltransferase